MDIKKVLQSRDVVRFHNHSGIDKQQLSDHQWGVAMIVWKIYPMASADLIMAALTHDVPEYLTGDIPAPVKWRNPKIKEIFDSLEEEVREEFGIEFDLSDEENRILKIADTMEGMWYCIQQLKQGNLSARRPLRLWAESLDNMTSDEKGFEILVMLELLGTETEKWIGVYNDSKQ